MKFHLLFPLLLAPLVKAEDLPELTKVNGWILQQEGNFQLADNAVQIIPKALVLGSLSYSPDTSLSSSSTNASLYGGVEVRWAPANGQRVTFDSLGSISSNLDSEYPFSGFANLSWMMATPRQASAAEVGIRASSIELPQISGSYFSIAETASADWTLKGDHSQAGISASVVDLRFLESSIFWTGDQRDSTNERLTLRGDYGISSRLDIITLGSVESVQWASNDRLQNGSATHLEGGLRLGLTERLTFNLVAGAVNWNFAAPYAQDPIADDQHSIFGTFRAALIWKDIEDPLDPARIEISATQEVLPGLNSNLSIYQHFDLICYHPMNRRFTFILHSTLGKADDQGQATLYGPPEREASLTFRPLLFFTSAHRISYDLYASSRTFRAEVNGNSQEYSIGIGAGAIF